MAFSSMSNGFLVVLLFCLLSSRSALALPSQRFTNETFDTNSTTLRQPFSLTEKASNSSSLQTGSVNATLSARQLGNGSVSLNASDIAANPRLSIRQSNVTGSVNASLDARSTNNASIPSNSSTAFSKFNLFRRQVNKVSFHNSSLAANANSTMGKSNAANFAHAESSTASSSTVLAASETSTATSSRSATATSTGVATSDSNSTTTWKNVMYFPNWDIYGRNYQPDNLPVDIITHVIYAFANVRDTGEVYLSDSYADTDKHYPGDSWSDSGNNTYGCTKQLYMLKQKNRGLKTLFSIGGWTYSPNFVKPASTEDGRTKFAQTSVSFVKNLGFDGIDIDWEYPKSPEEADNFVSLLQSVRAELDNYASTLPNNPHFLLTVASPAGPDNYNQLKVPEMDAYLDFWNLMAYDFAGSFSNVSGHQANIYPSKENPDSTPFSADAAVQYYIQAGLKPEKIVLGMPLYGRAFEETEGPGKAYSGVGEGSWENGIWDYKVLPKEGAEVVYDADIIAAYTYDNSTQTLVSYDSPESVKGKVKYIQDMKLGGAMWWEANGDFKDDASRSLVDETVKGLGGSLDMSENVLAYPDSSYTNIKSGMKQGT